MEVDWSDLPKDLRRITDDDKSKIVFRILTYVLYPKDDAHCARHRARMRARQALNQMLRLEKRGHKKSREYQGLREEFEALGGQQILRNAHRESYYFRTKIKRNWLEWRSIYAQHDLIYRAANSNFDITLGRARWAVLIGRKDLQFEIVSTRAKIIDATKTNRLSIPLIMGLFSCIPLDCKPQSLNQLQSACVKEFTHLISEIVRYQDFLTNFKVPHSRGEEADKRHWSIPASVTPRPTTSRKSAIKVTDNERTLLKNFNQNEYNYLSPSSARRHARELLKFEKQI